MKKALLLIVCIALPLVATFSPAAETNVSKFFADKDGCFLLYDMKSDKTICRFNEKRCAARVPPCSTFKVALSLTAFDQGILRDETTTYKWDGKDRGNPVWNRDSSAADWIKNSVFWYSQRVVRQMKAETLRGYLKKFDYGNQDMSGTPDGFWLDSSLAISPDEQLQFMKRLWRGDLPVSTRAIEITRKLMYLETSPAGVVLSGKTGSGHLHPEKHDGLGIGWFIAHISGPHGEYLAVVNYSDQKPEKDYPGLIAKQICKDILTDLKLY